MLPAFSFCVPLGGGLLGACCCTRKAKPAAVLVIATPAAVPAAVLVQQASRKAWFKDSSAPLQPLQRPPCGVTFQRPPVRWQLTWAVYVLVLELVRRALAGSSSTLLNGHVFH